MARWRLVQFPVILFAILEVGIRIIAPQPPRGFSGSLFEHRDGLAFLAPGSEGTQYSREFDVRIEGDSRGYRQGLSRHADSADVLIFGDSFGFGWGVEAADAATGILAGEGRPIRNCAMPGDGIGDYRRRLALETSGGRNAGILFLLYDNDLSEWSDSTPAEKDSFEPITMKIRRVLLGSHVMRALGRYIDSHGFSKTVAGNSGYDDLLRYILNRDLGVHRITGGPPGGAMADLGRLLREAVEVSGGPVFVVRLVPVYAAGGVRTREALELLGETDASFDLDRLGRELATVCADAGARFSEFGPGTEAEERRWYFPYDMHLTPEGQRALALHLRALLDTFQASSGH